jgi:hypothetical protein
MQARLLQTFAGRRSRFPTLSGIQEGYMRFSLFSKSLILKTLILTMALATFAYAAGAAHKGSLHITAPVQVNGKQLPAGDYTVTWEGDGPSVNLHISRDRQELASAAAKVVPLDRKVNEDTALVSNNQGQRELTAMRFSGKQFELEITGDAADTMKSANGVK